MKQKQATTKYFGFPQFYHLAGQSVFYSLRVFIIVVIMLEKSSLHGSLRNLNDLKSHGLADFR